MSEEYQFTTEAIDQYYNGPDEWQVISNNNIKPEDAETVLGQVPNVDVVKSDNGKVLSYNFKASENVASDAAEAVNSNTPPNVKSFDIPANTAVDSGGNMTFVSGMSKAGNFVFTKVVPAVAAAGVGIELGKLFDKVLYNTNPDFWDEKGMSTLDPDKWGDIIGTDTLGGRFFNMILGTTPDNKTQAYIDQNALAYTALYMQNKGVFNAGENTFTNENLDEFDINSYKCKFVNNFTLEPVALNYHYAGNDDGRYYYLSEKQDNVYVCINTDSRYSMSDVYFVSKKPFTIKEEDNSIKNSQIVHTMLGNVSFVVGQTKRDINNYKYAYPLSLKLLNVVHNNSSNDFVMPGSSSLNDPDDAMPFSALLYGNGIDKTIGGIDGIGTQNNAKTPDLSGATTVQETLDALKQQYPELFSNAVTQNVVQPDGSTVTYTYVPIAMPELDPEGNPVSSTSTQANPQIDPATATAPLLDVITKLLQKDTPVNPPDTGSGDTPVIVIPTGSANALYSIYNPSQAQLNSFGAWLWSSDFVDQLLKLFNDPMQAIIGLHKVFANPSISGTGNIKVGYIDSGVSSNIVGNQYTTVDCGSVSLSEYFGNVFDYEPYTKVNLYLPFIGIVPLSVGEVMRSTIHVVYHVDVLTGACLAEVKIKRDSAGGTLFQYSGNAAVQYPISSGSYMGIISGIMSIAGGVAGTIATGGAAMPVLLGAGASVGRMHTDISHSGSFSGNAGAMGIKKPYLIIDRPQTALAKNFPNYIGYPSNTTVKLSSCHGFTKVKEIHLENVPATNNELSDIEMKLKGGVII